MRSVQEGKKTKVAEEYCWPVPRRRNGPAEPNQVPVICSLDFNLPALHIYIYIYIYIGLWGRQVVAQLVEALRYKSECRGLDSRWCHWNFPLT